MSIKQLSFIYLCLCLPESAPAVSRMSDTNKSEEPQSLVKHKMFLFGSTDKPGVTKSMKFTGEADIGERSQGQGQTLL